MDDINSLIIILSYIILINRAFIDKLEMTLDSQIKTPPTSEDIYFPILEDGEIIKKTPGKFGLRPRFESTKYHSSSSAMYRSIQNINDHTFLNEKPDSPQENIVSYVSEEECSSPRGADFVPELLLPLSISSPWSHALTTKTPCHISASPSSGSSPMTISPENYNTPKPFLFIEDNNISHTKDIVKRYPRRSTPVEKLPISRTKHSKVYFNGQSRTMKHKYQLLQTLRNHSNFPSSNNEAWAFNVFSRTEI